MNAVKQAGLYAETLPAQINNLPACEVIMGEVKEVVSGLWKNNSALVQLLGICPLLAVTSTAAMRLVSVWQRPFTGADSDQPFHLLPTAAGPRRNPYSDLRYDRASVVSIVQM